MFEKKEVTTEREAWKVKAVPQPKKSCWPDAWRRRREPSAFQRCLAVHIHFASPRGGLS